MKIETEEQYKKEIKQIETWLLTNEYPENYDEILNAVEDYEIKTGRLNVIDSPKAEIGSFISASAPKAEDIERWGMSKSNLPKFKNPPPPPKKKVKFDPNKVIKSEPRMIMENFQEPSPKKKDTVQSAMKYKKEFLNDLDLEACIMEVLEKYKQIESAGSGVTFYAVGDKDFQNVAEEIIKNYRGL